MSAQTGRGMRREEELTCAWNILHCCDVESFYIDDPACVVTKARERINALKSLDESKACSFKKFESKLAIQITRTVYDVDGVMGEFANAVSTICRWELSGLLSHVSWPAM